MIVYVAEVTAYNLVTKAVETLYYSTTGWVSDSGDTPAHTHFAPRIDRGLDIGRWMFAPGKTTGKSRRNAGDMILHNGDGALDGLIDYAFDGRTLIVRRGETDGFGNWPAYPSGFRQIFCGTMEQPEITRPIVRLKVRDLQEAVDNPLQATFFAGAGADLIANGGFADGTGWTIGPASGWSISGGTASGNGVMTGTLSQLAADLANPIVDGVLYKVTITISGRSAGGIDITIGGGTSGPRLSSNGTHIQFIVAGSGDDDVVITSDDVGGTWDGDIDDFSVVAALEGADDIKGKPKPVCYGKVKNISPPLVDSAKLIYQVNDGTINSIDEVRDRGVILGEPSSAFSWTDVSGNETESSRPEAIAYSPERGLYVAVAVILSSERILGPLLTSPDGLTWTARTVDPAGGTSHRLFGVAYGAGVFVVCGEDSNGDAAIWTSPDGIVWSEQTSNFTSTVVPSCIAWSPEQSIFVCGASGGELVSSPDGVTWTARTANMGTEQILGVAWGAGSSDLFVAVGTDGDMATSPDGITWTARTSSFGTSIIESVVFAPALDTWVAVGRDNKIASSTNGTSWTQRTSPFVASSVIEGVHWDDRFGEFLAIAHQGTAHEVGSSTDGTTWGTEVAPPGTAGVSEIFIGPDRILTCHDRVISASPIPYRPYTSLADLMDDAQAPLPGTIGSYPGGGFIRLGSTPSGTLTVDATQGAAAADRTAGQLFTDVLLKAGYTSGDWVAEDITVLDVLEDAVLGFWNGVNPINTSEVLSQIALSVGAAWWIDRLGKFRIKQLRDPDAYPWDGDSDIIANGDFATDTIWVKGTGWSISGGNASNGTNATEISQTPLRALVEGLVYQVQFTIGSRTAGSLTPKVGGTSGTAVTTSGNYLEDIIAGTGADIAFLATADWDGTLDDVKAFPVGFLGDFSANDMVKPMERLAASDRSGGLPTYRYQVNHSRNYTVQKDLAASVGDSVKAELALEWQQENKEETDIQTAHLLARSVIDDSLLTASVDALAEATRRQFLRNRRRDRYQLTVGLDDVTSRIDIGDIIHVKHPRYAPEGIEANPDYKRDLNFNFLADLDGKNGFAHMFGDTAGRFLQVDPVGGGIRSPGWFDVASHVNGAMFFDGADYWAFHRTLRTVRQMTGIANPVANTYDFSANTDVNAGDFHGAWIDVPNQRIYCGSDNNQVIIRGAASWGVTTDVAVDVSGSIAHMEGFTFDRNGNLVVMDATNHDLHRYDGFSNTVVDTVPLDSRYWGTKRSPSFTKDGDLAILATDTPLSGSDAGIVVFHGFTNAFRRMTVAGSSFWDSSPGPGLHMGHVSYGRKLVVIGLKVESKKHLVTITGWG